MRHLSLSVTWVSLTRTSATIVDRAALQEELDRVSASDADLLIIDLRDLDFMDSTGLSVLVRAHQRAEEQGRQLAMVKGPQQVQRLLSLTGVADRLTVVDRPEDLLPDA